MKPFEIYWGKDIKWGKNCDFQHRWVIIDVRGDVFGCFPISSSCYGQDCFEVSEGDPNFKYTGLKHTSKIIFTSIYEFSADDFASRTGELVGELLVEFRKVAGV